MEKKEYQKPSVLIIRNVSSVLLSGSGAGETDPSIDENGGWVDPGEGE